MSEQRRPSAAVRRRLIADLEAILQVEPWPEAALPVKASIVRSKWRSLSGKWWASIEASGRSGLLGREDCVGRQFGAGSTNDPFGNPRVVARFRIWCDRAWEAGVRRVFVETAAMASAHQAIAWEARAQAYDPQPSQEQPGEQS